jgi:hypothetical protein
VTKQLLRIFGPELFQLMDELKQREAEARFFFCGVSREFLKTLHK